MLKIDSAKYTIKRFYRIILFALKKKPNQKQSIEEENFILTDIFTYLFLIFISQILV